MTRCPSNQECIYSGLEEVKGTCVCPRGFTLLADGSCVDVNECEQHKFPCGPGALCLNTVGSYQCSCPPKTTGSPYDEGCIGMDNLIIFLKNNNID